VIDSSACVVHVIHAPTTTDLADTTFSLPGLSPGSVSTLVDTTTPAPGPFPVGAVFGVHGPFDAVYAAPTGVVVTFASRVTDGGVTSLNDSGVFSWSTGGTLTTHAREGDPTCAPTWPGAGATYADLYSTHRLGAAVVGGPAAAFAARSNGGVSNSAIVLNAGGCGGSTVIVAARGAATPAGGVYADLMSSVVELATSATGETVFVAPITGSPMFAVFTSSGDVVVRHRMADTALGASLAYLSGQHVNPAINSGGDVVFSARVIGISVSLLFDTPAILPELLAQRGQYARIDDLGNVVALFK